MADADTARLCELIIRSHFGSLTAIVASVLLTRGRLPLSHLIRFSGLKPRTVRAAILVLVQHNLLWHAQSDDDGEVLEVNITECLLRLRFGRYVHQAEQLFGKAGADIIQLILDHGKMRPPDLISRLSVYDPVEAPAMYSQMLRKLIGSSYLKPSTLLSHFSPRDKRIKYEAEEKAKISGFPTAKELRQAKETAQARLKREEEAPEQTSMDETYFRINCEKFNIHIRNNLIEHAAVERFNETTGLVLRAVLKSTEAKQKQLADTRSDPTSIANVAMQLPEEVDLSTGLILQLSKKPSAAALIKDYLGLLASADNPTPAGRAASFVSMNGSKVQVEFDIIARRLQRRVLEAITRERHGDDGVRIVRLLLDTGKMDEKQISKIGMMANKDVRPLLSALSADSLISLQEVPKSADRNPTRTFYLWYVDLQKARSVLLDNLYKTLYNILFRKQAEEEESNVKAVLEKRQRSDVSQDEERLLTRIERETLVDWEKRRDKLTVLEMRIEEAVFIIHDLGALSNSDE